MKYTVESAYEWLYPDSSGSDSNLPLRLLAARNGTAAFQLLLRDTPAGLLYAAVDSDFRWELFQELPVLCPRNTGIKGFTIEDKADSWENAKNWCTREAPFYVYDALRPIPGEGVASERNTTALYCSVTVPEAAVPGVYPFTLSVRLGEECVVLPGTLEVTRACVAAETLKITNWFSIANIIRFHSVEPFSEAYWAMLREYGLLMRRCRQNVFWIHQELFRSEQKENGTWNFDFSNVRRLIEMYLELGFTTIEASPFFQRNAWGDHEFFVQTPEGRIPALSDEGYAYTAAFLSAWYDFLRENGWLDCVIQHVADEPHQGCADAYRMLSGIVRKFMPGVPLIEAVELPELNGAVDIWVPKGNHYESLREAYDAHRAQGDQIWHYTCCIPGGHFANRLLDIPLNRCRMLYWGNYVYHMPGFLHWGLNFIRGEDPFTDTSPLHGWENHYLPSGDTHCVYPIAGTHTVCSSMRMEQQKGGAEEYELLSQLAQRDKALADEIAASCFRHFDDCDNTLQVFVSARERLLRSF